MQSRSIEQLLSKMQRRERSPPPSAIWAADEELADFDQAGRELLATLHLEGDSTSERNSKHNHLDAIWADPKTKARVFIGGQSAARSEKILLEHGITHIINCQDLSSPNYHERNPTFHYCRFPVAHWYNHPTDTTQVSPHTTSSRPLCVHHAWYSSHRSLMWCTGSTGVLPRAPCLH